MRSEFVGRSTPRGNFIPNLSKPGLTVSTTILPTRSNRDQRSSGPGRATLIALFPWLLAGKLFQLKKKPCPPPHTMKVTKKTSSLVVTTNDVQIYISNRTHLGWFCCGGGNMLTHSGQLLLSSLRLHHLHVEACETWVSRLPLGPTSAIREIRDTVDGRNPAPFDMEIQNIPFFIGFHAGFFHQQ